MASSANVSGGEQLAPQTLVSSLPDAPGGGEPTAVASPEPIMPVSAPKPRQTDEGFPRKKKIWLSLLVAEHSAAAFDAWSTRAAIGRGAHELNPTLRPFSHSAVMYPATQVLPVGMDYLAFRMMHSENHLLRRFWWLPQAASTLVSVSVGVHNIGVDRGRN